MAFAQAKYLATALLAVSLVAAGAGLLAGRVGSTNPPPRQHKPSDVRAVEPHPARAARRQLTDLYGDALPPGALVRLGTVRLRHGGFCQVAFSRDGKTLISVDATTARFWDPITGALLRQTHFPLPAAPKAEGAAASHGRYTMSADGRTLAVCDGSSLRRWDIATGKQRGRFPTGLQAFGPRASVDQFALAADGKTVALAMEDPDQETTTIRVCDLIGGKERWRTTMVGRGSRPYCAPLLFSPNSRVLAVDDSEQHLHLWHVPTGKELHRIKMYPREMAFSPDSKLLVTTGGSEPILWDVAMGRQQATLPHDRNGIYVAAFSPDGRALAVGDNARVVLYDLPTRQVRHRFPHVSIDHLAFTPDSKILATVSEGSIRLWDTATGKAMHDWLAPDRNVSTLVASPDGRLVASFASFNSGVYLWDTATGRCRHIFRDPQRWTYACCFSADGKQLISGARDIAYVWDISTSKEITRFTMPDYRHGLNKPDIETLQLSTDGRRLAVISDQGRAAPAMRINVWDTNTKKLLVDRPMPGGFGRYVFSPDATSVAIHVGKNLLVQQVMTGRGWTAKPANLRAPLRFSADSRLLAAGRFAGPAFSDKQLGLTLLEVATGQTVCTIDCGDAPFVDFAPDGRLLATGDRKAIRIWDLATGKEIFRRAVSVPPPPHTLESGALHLVFLPDGQRIARAMSDTTILIWDVLPAHRYLTHAPRPLPDEDLKQLWDDLASKDAARAYQAGWALQGKPGPTIAFLQGRLHPAPKPDAQRLKRLIAELDSRRFAARQAASQELAQIGPVAEPALRQALQSNPSAEMRRRLEKLLDAGSSLAASSDLRTLRAIAVLEGIGTAPARHLLTVLAGGASNAPVTAAARAALERLDKQGAQAKIEK